LPAQAKTATPRADNRLNLFEPAASAIDTLLPEPILSLCCERS